MITCHLVPPDSELYQAAEDYVGSIAVMRRASAQMISLCDLARAERHARLEALLVRHGIEFYDKDDVLNVAVELAQLSQGGDIR